MSRPASRKASAMQSESNLSPVDEEAHSINELQNIRPISPVRPYAPISLDKTSTDISRAQIQVYGKQQQQQQPLLAPLQTNSFGVSRSSEELNDQVAPLKGFRSGSPAFNGVTRADSPSSFVSVPGYRADSPVSIGHGYRSTSQASLLPGGAGRLRPDSRNSSMGGLSKNVTFGNGIRTVSGASSIGEFENDGDTAQMPARSHRKALWTPWVLTLPSLVGFTIAAIIVVVALALINAVLVNEGGFNTNNSTFLWTYGPSFLYVGLAVYWAQVDYWTKQMMPWKTMSNGSAPARSTLLADYITPWRFMDSLLAGLRHNHWAVTIVTTNSILLKLLIIAWSGPLMLITVTDGTDNVMPRFIVKGAARHTNAAAGVLFILLTIVLVFIRPAKSTPRDVSTLAGLSLVLASSTGLDQAMKGRAGMPNKIFKRWVSRANFSTVITHEARGKEAFKIRMSAGDEESAKSLMNHVEIRQPTVWWKPLPDTIRILAPAIPPAILFVLEMLMQRSTDENGLSDVTSDAQQYQWALWPGAVMLALYIEYGIFDFHAKVVQPYAQLRADRSESRMSIGLNYLGQFQPAAIKDAIKGGRYSHWSVIATSLVMILSPITIVASSGLFQLRISGFTTQTNVQLSDQFNLARVGTADAAKVSTAASTALAANGTWPQWTYDNMVIPQMNLSVPATASNLSSTLDATVPVILASINCSIVPASNVKFWDANGVVSNTSALTNDNTTTTTNITLSNSVAAVSNSTTTLSKRATGLYNIAVPVPKGCGAPCIKNDHVNTCSDTTDYYFALNITATTGSQVFGRVLVAKPDPAPAGWSDSCPHLVSVYGGSIDDQKFATEATYLTCSPSVYAANVSASFSLPDWSIQSPNVDNASTKTVATGDTATIDINAYLPKKSITQADVDPAFAAIMSGGTNIPLSSLSDSTKAEEVGVAMAKTYTRVMAQYINLNLRQTSQTNAPNNPASQRQVQGILTSPTIIRMYQNLAPTRIIQVILAITFFLLLVPLVTLEAKNLIPRNPCSIAAQVVLLADSELTKRDLIPQGSEWMNDRQLHRTAMFDGLQFSLGLWERSERVAGMSVHYPPGFGALGYGSGNGKEKAGGPPGGPPGGGDEVKSVFGIDVGNADRIY